ncbi:MAG: DUF4249 domain-containing protein, partial [Flavobacteriaceae bacterium]|nr:DUF4249 domain-containing protein [Flavobacteriaceae bacterium]
MSVLALIFIVSCVEELDLDLLSPSDYNGPLVIEAILTDEVKRQEIYLSRADTRIDLIEDSVYIRYLQINRGSRDSVIDETNANI